MSKNYVLIGDSHRQVSTQLERVRNTFPDYKPEETVVILLGDVGLNVYNNKSDWKAKHKASKFGYTLYCLRGNHELRCSQVPNLYFIWDEEVQGNVWYEPEFPNIKYLSDTAGIYHFGGYKCLIIPGAYSVDKYYRLQNNWFWNPEEQLTEIEMGNGMRLADGNSFDFILSHTCPMSYMPKHLFLDCIDQNKVDNTMEWWLEEVSNACDWKYLCFAHYHSDEIIAPHVQLIYQKPLAMDAIASYWDNYDKEGSSLGQC